MIATVVEMSDLLEVVWVSLIAGIGVTGAFGVAILGGTRALDSRRDGRTVQAAMFGALGSVSIVAVMAAIVFGIVVLVDK